MSDTESAGVKDEPQSRLNLLDDAAAESDNDNSQQDSSEEEEDDEDAMRKVAEGFIVDDEEQDNDSNKPRRKKRKAFITDEEELDEDDLELLRENAGESSHTLKRLKRDAKLDDMFSDEEKIEEEPRGEFDDFIEDDEEDDDRDEKLARMRSVGTKQFGSAGQSRIDQDKLDELFEIFGDGDEYAWALEAENVGGDGDDNDEDGDADQDEFDDEFNSKFGIDKSQNKNGLADVFEYEELKGHLLTDHDESIRIKDIPERFQLLREGIKNYDLDNAAFAEKQDWIAETLLKENWSSLEDKSNLHEPFKEAVKTMVTFISRENLEVPSIWNSKKDYTLFTHNEDGKLRAEKLLNENDLWRIIRLDVDYHAILEKKSNVKSLYDSLNQIDLTFEDAFLSAQTVTDLQDLYDYLHFTYSEKIKQIQEQSKGESSSNKKKIHSRYTFYDRIKKDPIYEGVIKKFGIDADKYGENIAEGVRIHNTDDNEKSYFDLIKQVLPDSYFMTVDSATNAVKQLFSEQLLHNPKLRAHVRKNFQDYSTVDIQLTEKGRANITDASPYADFKYAMNKTFDSFVHSPDLFLRMLEAESLGLVNVKIGLKSALNDFTDHLSTLLVSTGTSEISQSWNKIRRECLNNAINKLIPSVVLAVKENLAQTSERLLFFKIRSTFLSKVDQAPYTPFPNVRGTIPKVLALSNGEGQRDSAVIGIAMNYDGSISEHVKFEENYRDQEFERKLLQLIDRFAPEVIAISGYNVQISHLKKRVEEIVKLNKKMVSPEIIGDEIDDQEEPVELPVLYIPNETSRLFEHSDRANEEFSDKPVVAKFCIGLARYVQSPLLEYIALGDTVTTISIHKYQTLLPEHKLMEAIESVFVDMTSLTGIKINDAIRHPYLAQSLQYISGLGPRKANSLIKGIESNGGALVRRDDLVQKGLTTKTIFMNCAPFIELPAPDTYDKDVELLDGTRIHPQDYDLAIKMAADALDLEEEDLPEVESQDGGIIGKLYEEGVHKLDELSLDGYANQLETLGHQKRASLLMIKEELLQNYEELRNAFHIMNEEEVFEMLTGETKESFDRGILVPVIIQKVDNRFLLVLTQSGVFGNVSKANAIFFGSSEPLTSKFQTGQAVQAVVKSVDYLDFKAEFSLIKEDINRAKSIRKGDRHADYWNFAAEEADIKHQRDLERSESRSTMRHLKHPYFHPFDHKQAETYLASRDNGEFVIRPSSKGNDHLTITWKVDNQLFQHIDILEKDKPNEFTLGKTLLVKEGDHSYIYHDLDELIVSHIHELHAKALSLSNSDKFKHEPLSEVKEWLIRYSKANKGRGTYCFSMNRKRAGWVLLLFTIGEKVYAWNVRIVVGGYELKGGIYPNVAGLCNGFKKLVSGGGVGNNGPSSSRW